MPSPEMPYAVRLSSYANGWATAAGQGRVSHKNTTIGACCCIPSLPTMASRSGKAPTTIDATGRH